MMDPPDDSIIQIGIPHEKFRETTLDLMEHDAAYHVLGYSWIKGSPVWTLLPMKKYLGTLIAAGDPADVELTGMGEMDLRISSTSHCVGRFEGGVHIPCPEASMVSGFSQCPSCMAYDIPDPTCIFEPHCNRGSCGASFCQVEHVVYIAAFRSRLKVGMTQKRRLNTRAMEQGADMIMPVMVLGDRYSARVMERKLSGVLGIPEMISRAVKVRSWSMPRREGDMRRSLHDVRDRCISKMEEITPVRRDDISVIRGPGDMDVEPVLLDYPLVEPLSAAPRMYGGSIVRGSIVGFKGRNMIFKSGGLQAFGIGASPGRMVYFSKRIYQAHSRSPFFPVGKMNPRTISTGKTMKAM